MSKLDFVIKLFHSLGRKIAAKKAGKITTALNAEAEAASMYTTLVEAGLKPKDMHKFIKSESDILKYLNQIEAINKQRTAQETLSSGLGKYFKKEGEVIEFPRDKITDWRKPRPGETGDITGIGPQVDTVQGINKRIKGRVENINKILEDEKKTLDEFKKLDIKQRGPQRGVGAGEQVGAAGATRIKQGFSTQSKLNHWSQNQQWVKDFIGRKNAEFNSLNRADQKEVLDMFEAQIKKHKPKEPLAGGGIAGMLGEPTYQDDNHRVPFKLGGIDKVRRAFLQAMGAGAAGIGAAKSGLFGLLKGGGKKQIVENLTQVPIHSVEGMPAWFKPLVNRVIKEGKDITNLPPNKGGALAEREIVHSAKLGENQGVRVSQNLDDQTIRVEYQSADNMGGIDDVVYLEYKGSKEVATKKGSVKTKPTFEANEAWPHGTTGDYKDITMEGTNTVGKVDDLYSDTSALKQFGTGKDLSKKELAIAKQKRKRVNEINNDLAEQDQLLPEPSPPDDFASGGRVPFVGGGWAFKLAKKFRESPEYKKFIEKLFLKASNDIRKGEGMFKDLTASQKITQHDNLTNEITKFQKTGEIPESVHQYFGFNPEQKYADKLLQKQLNMTPEEELRHEFPGITDDLVNKILTDTNTQRIAEVKATMKEALKMQEKGMGTEEIINIFKNIKPTKHASGGLAGMLGE